MISIIIKDIKESYAKILLSALGIMFILYLIDAFDMASLIIFGFIAPIYVIAISHASFSREKSLGTDKLLVSLPLSKTKVWFGKVIGSFMNGLFVYLLFLLLLFIFGIDITPFFPNTHRYEMVVVYMVFVLPFFSWAIGSMTGTLHQVLSVFVLTSVPIIILLPLYVGGQGVLGMSPLWVAIISCMTCLSTSFFIFKNYYELKGLQLITMNIKKLLAGAFIVVCSMFILNYFGQVMNRNWSRIIAVKFEQNSIQGLSTLCFCRDTKFLDLYFGKSAAGAHNPMTYDYRLLDENFITNDEKLGFYKADLNKVKLTTFAKRDVRNVVFDSKLEKVLFESKLNNPILLYNSLYMQDIATSKTTYIDSLSIPLGFLDDGNVVYYSYANKETGVTIPERRGTGRDVEKSYISLKLWNINTHTISEVASFSNKANFEIIPNSKKVIVHYPGKDSRIIRLDNFKVVRLKHLLKLPDKCVIKHIASRRISDFITVENTENKNKRYFQVNQNNQFREIDFGNVVTPKHKIAFLDENSQGTSFYTMKREVFTRTLKEVEENKNLNEKLLMCKRDGIPVAINEHNYISALGLFTNSGNHFLFEYRDGDTGYSMMSIIDTSTLQIKMKDSSKGYLYVSDVKPFRSDSFMISDSNAVAYFNHITQKPVHLYDIKDILRKEGIIND